MTDKRKTLLDSLTKQYSGEYEQAKGGITDEENLEDLNSLYEQHMEKNVQKGRTSLLTSSASQATPFSHSNNRTFDSKGITTSSVGTQSVQALHQKVCSLEPTNLDEVRNLVDLAHRSPVKTDTSNLIDNYVMQNNFRNKISGRKPKSKVVWRHSPQNSRVEEDPDEASFSGITAEGLYKQEQQAIAQKYSQFKESKDNNPSQIYSRILPDKWMNRDESSYMNQYDGGMPRTAILIKQQREHEIVKNALDSSKYDFSSTIHSSDSTFSKSGLYRRNEMGQRVPYSNESASYTKPLLGNTEHRSQYLNSIQSKYQERVTKQSPSTFGGASQKSIAKNKDPNSQEVHFFESPSRYIPLKVFNQLYGSTFSNQMEVTVQARSKDPKIQMVRKWFQSLSLQEQSVAITTVDKELVQLFKAMYKVYANEGYHGGDFTAKLEFCNSPEEAGTYKSVGNYQLLYQQNQISRSQYIGKQNQAANLIIENTRIVSIKEPNDALTLDVNLISCYSFFLEIMKLLDNEFLQREYKVVKASANQISGSLLVGLTHQSQSTEQSGAAGNGGSGGVGQRQTKEKPYFIVREEHKPVYAASRPNSTQFDRDGRRDGYSSRMTGSDDDETLEMPGYRSMVRYDQQFNSYESQRERDENHVSFAKCLLLMFEKAINVQFQDYLDKLQQTAMQSFFFIGKNELQDNIFSEDLKIADFWQKIDEDRKQALMSQPLNHMIKDLMADYNKWHKPFENIAESAEYEEDCDGSNSCKSHYEQLEYDSAMDFLNKPFQAERVDIAKDGTKLTPLPTEYTEFNGQSLITSTEQMPQYKKPRRSRQDRRRGGTNSGTMTSSSSGVNMTGATVSSSLYDYNPNQLTSQYGNQTSQQQAGVNYSEDLELGIGTSAATFSINNDQMSDQADCDEQMDPENLMPLTHFSNARSGIDKGVEETKDPKKKNKKLPKISVSVPAQQKKSEEQEARNDLFSKSNPESILFGHKQTILSNGLKARNDFLECLKFIKSLSANKNFEYALREFQPNQVSGTAVSSSLAQSPRQKQSQQKNKKGKKAGKQSGQDTDGAAESQSLSQWELTNATTAFKKRLQSAFLKHLAEECQKSILDDLFLDTTSEKPQASSSQKTAQKSKDIQATTSSTLKEETKETAQASGEATSSATAQPATASSKRQKKKQKRKKNKRAAVVIDTTSNTDATAGSKANETQEANPESDQPESRQDAEARIQKQGQADKIQVGSGPQEIEMLPIVGRKKKKAKLSDYEDEEDQNQLNESAQDETYLGKNDDSLIEEAKLQQVLRVQQELAKVRKQDDQLEEIRHQFEKLETVESYLNEGIDPQTALEMTGLQFQSDDLQLIRDTTQIDPQYLDMLQEHKNLTDEELGLGNSLISDNNSNAKGNMKRYEDWIRWQTTKSTSVDRLSTSPRAKLLKPSSDYERATQTIRESKEQNAKLFNDLNLLSSKLNSKRMPLKVPMNNRSDSEPHSDDLQDQAQESLINMLPIGYRPPMPQNVTNDEMHQLQRFTDERRGLLTNEVHLDKYVQETLNDLPNAINGTGDSSDIEDDQELEKREKQKMLDHVLWNEYMAKSTKLSKQEAGKHRSSDSQLDVTHQSRFGAPKKSEKDLERERKAFANEVFNKMQADALQNSPSRQKKNYLIDSTDSSFAGSRSDFISKQIKESREALQLTIRDPFSSSGTNGQFCDPTVIIQTARTQGRGLVGSERKVPTNIADSQKTEDHTEQSGGTVIDSATKTVADSADKTAVAAQPSKKKNNKKNRRKKQKNKQAEQQATNQSLAAADSDANATKAEETKKEETSAAQKKTTEEAKTAQWPHNSSKFATKILEDDVEEVILDDNDEMSKAKTNQDGDEDDNRASKTKLDDKPDPKVNTFFSSESDKGLSANEASASQPTSVAKTAILGSKQAKKEAKRQRKALNAVQAQDVQAREKARNEAVPDEVVMIDSSADGSDKEQESYVMDLTKNLISNSVNSAAAVNTSLNNNNASTVNATATTTAPNTIGQKSKGNRKKRNKKRQQEERLKAEQAAKEKEAQAAATAQREHQNSGSDEETKKEKLDEPKKGASISKISFKSSTTNSLANFDSTYTFDPFVKIISRQRVNTHRFKADLSDSVSIPERGTRSGSHQQREQENSANEQEHSNLLRELDSLFPCNNKGSHINSSGSMSKIRSSTLSKTRQNNYLVSHVGAFTTSQKHLVRQDSPTKDSDMLLPNAIKDTDILSQQQTKPKSNMLMVEDHDLDKSQSPRKAPITLAESGDIKLRDSSAKAAIQKPTEKNPTKEPSKIGNAAEAQPVLTKAQQRQLKKSKRQQAQQQQMQQQEKEKSGAVPSQQEPTVQAEEPKTTGKNEKAFEKNQSNQKVQQQPTSSTQKQPKEQVIVAGPTNAATRNTQKNNNPNQGKQSQQTLTPGPQGGNNKAQGAKQSAQSTVVEKQPSTAQQNQSTASQQAKKQPDTGKPSESSKPSQTAKDTAPSQNTQVEKQATAKTSTQKKQKNGAATSTSSTVAPKQAPMLTNNFSSYSNMFETIFGAKSISSNKAQTETKGSSASTAQQSSATKEAQADATTKAEPPTTDKKAQQASSKQQQANQNNSSNQGKNANQKGQQQKKTGQDSAPLTGQTTSQKEKNGGASGTQSSSQVQSAKATTAGNDNNNSSGAKQQNLKPIARSQASISEVFGSLAANNGQQQTSKHQQQEVAKSNQQSNKSKQPVSSSSTQPQYAEKSTNNKDKQPKNSPSVNDSNSKSKGGNEAPQPVAQPSQQMHGGIGVMMTPSRAAQTQVMEQQKFPQANNTFVMHQQRAAFQSQQYQQSYFQTPTMMAPPSQAFQPGPAPPACNTFTPGVTTQVDKSKMVSSYFQTTTQKQSNDNSSVVQESSQQTQMTTAAMSQTTTATEEQKQHRGVQFPFKNNAQGSTTPALVTPGSQVSSVQINLSIINNQTTCIQPPPQGFNPTQQQRQVGQTGANPNMYFQGHPPQQQQQIHQMNIPNQQMVMQYVKGFLQNAPPQQQFTPQQTGPGGQQMPFNPVASQFANNGGHQQHPFMFQNQHQIMMPPPPAQPAGTTAMQNPSYQPNMPLQQPFNNSHGQGSHMLHQPMAMNNPTRPVGSHESGAPAQATANSSPQKPMAKSANSPFEKPASSNGKSQSSGGKGNKQGETEKLQSKQQLQQTSSPSQTASTLTTQKNNGNSKTNINSKESQQSPTKTSPQTTPQQNTNNSQLAIPQQQQPITTSASPTQQLPMNAQAIYHQPMPFNNSSPGGGVSPATQHTQPMPFVSRQQFSQSNKFQFQGQQLHQMPQPQNQSFVQQNQFNTGGTFLQAQGSTQNSQQSQVTHHPQHFPNYNQGKGHQMLPFQMPPPQLPHQQQFQMPPHMGYQPRMPLQPITVFEPISLVQALYSNESFGDKSPYSSSLSRSSNNEYESRFFELIGSQILDMQAKIEERLSKVEKLRQDCFDKLFQLAKQTYTEMPSDKIEFKVYGSMATKLAIDTSDMDISIHGVVDSKGVMDSQQLRTVIVQAMDRISGRLDAIDWIESNLLIDMAKVPVIKLVINLVKLDKLREPKDQVFDHENMTKEELSYYKSLKIDLIFNDILRARQVQDPYTGEFYTEQGDSQSTQKCAEFVKKQIGLHPFLKPLAIILKKYLALKSLNSPFYGTMSSYGLVLMLLALLKDLAVNNAVMESQPSGSQSFKQQLGKVFAHFLYVYGEQFSSQHISIDESSEFSENQQEISQAIFSGHSTVLQVTDPIDPSNNVGKQTWNFNLVQDQLHVTWQCLLVRFKELYEKVSIGEALLKKRGLVEKAHELKTKRQNAGNEKGKRSQVASPKETKQDNSVVDQKIVELPTSQIFEHMQNEQIEPANVSLTVQQTSESANSSTGKFPGQLTSEQNAAQLQRNIQIERLANRSVEQLADDLDHFRKMLDQNKEENQEISDNLLNMIVMIKKDDLTPLLNDDIEEKQKIMQQFSRDEKNYLVPLERLRLKLDHQQMLTTNSQPANQHNFLYGGSQMMMQGHQQQQPYMKHQMPPYHHQPQNMQQYSQGNNFAPGGNNFSPGQFGGHQSPTNGNNLLQGFNQQQFMEQLMAAANQKFSQYHGGQQQHFLGTPHQGGGGSGGRSQKHGQGAYGRGSADETSDGSQSTSQRPALHSHEAASSGAQNNSHVQYQVKGGQKGETMAPGKDEKQSQL